MYGVTVLTLQSTRLTVGCCCGKAGTRSVTSLRCVTQEVRVTKAYPVPPRLIRQRFLSLFSPMNANQIRPNLESTPVSLYLVVMGCGQTNSSSVSSLCYF